MKSSFCQRSSFNDLVNGRIHLTLRTIFRVREACTKHVNRFHLRLKTIFLAYVIGIPHNDALNSPIPFQLESRSAATFTHLLLMGMSEVP
jgi:hypothetical protein